jgi:hypothetical protein
LIAGIEIRSVMSVSGLINTRPKMDVDIREILLCIEAQQEELFPEIKEYRGLEWIE